jgi:hypothetical protein
LAHGIPAHLDAMSVVNQAIEDAVGGGGIADLFVPARDRQLGSEDGRARLIAILADLPEIAPFILGERSHGPVIDDQDIDAAESRQQIAQTAVGAGEREIAEQSGGAGVEHQMPVAAGFLGQGRASKKLLPTPVGPMMKMFS